MSDRHTTSAVNHSLPDSLPSRAPADQGTREQGNKGSDQGSRSDSPSTPTSRNAPRDPATMDGPPTNPDTTPRPIVSSERSAPVDLSDETRPAEEIDVPAFVRRIHSLPTAEAERFVTDHLAVVERECAELREERDRLRASLAKHRDAMVAEMHRADAAEADDHVPADRDDRRGERAVRSGGGRSRRADEAATGVQERTEGRTAVTAELDVAALCHWRRGLANDLSHVAFHFGSVCPYDAVAEVLAGRPDPRDLVAEWRLDITGALKPDGKVPLTLNDRGMHWAAKANATARVKAVVRNAVMAAEVPHLEHVHVELHYRPKTNRFRDIDNIVATLKPAIDALHHPDSSEKSPVPFEPIVDGDDPRFVTWSPPVLHAWQRGLPPALWLVLRSSSVSMVDGSSITGEQGQLL